ncbi:MAG: glycosyl hydrolase 115 family protein [Lachnospiraceae bacterium]|nr:glycosyl hydrolase 115 family protein [Lachnospiraceae bacterium]
MKIRKESGLTFIYESGTLSGIVKAAGWVSDDVEKCLGFKAKTEEIFALAALKSTEGPKVLFGTTDNGFVRELCADVEMIEGQREVYSFALADDDTLVICGSDKRGCIYGLLRLSDMLGVSPFVNWSNVVPPKKEELNISKSDCFVSKEPSVEYRGFFINDEWPCFGNWCTKNFGGVNAKMYAGVFEILLRMKGNYLWPAMWASNFAMDGPGLESAELADELGVVMGLSHHEPCLRHGEEYSMVRGKDSKYGDAWDFLSNEEGITEFWRDGLKRNGHLENVITLGMRGERDSMIMAEAGLGANIELIKKVLVTQNRLIKEEVCSDLSSVPRMIALYKEVEAYYYGDEKNEGLMDYPELDDVILMLCDDNHGYVRTLPDEKMRKHRGGFGMYYHFDYHGGPVSYEWIDSTHLPAVWEQMTTAYERGVSRLWIVNVGDLGMNEIPLNYFMDLAYDYDKWGISACNSTAAYMKQWFNRTFGAAFDDGITAELADMYMKYGRLMNNRRPEHMNAGIYSVKEGFEAEHILKQADEIEAVCRKAEEMCPDEYRDAFTELVSYKIHAGMNLIRMWIYSAYNHYYASLGLVAANDHAEKVKKCLKLDTELKDKLHTAADGKWYGFGMAEHIGFRNWNCEESTYPTLEYVTPVNKTDVCVGIVGESGYTCGGEWTGKRLKLSVYDHEDEHEAYGRIFVATRGTERAEFMLSTSDEWIKPERTGGRVGLGEPYTEIGVRIDKDMLKKEAEPYTAKGELSVSIGSVCIRIDVFTLICDMAGDVFVEENGMVVMNAADYSSLKEGRAGKFTVLSDLGRNEDAIKLFPVDKGIDDAADAPVADYSFMISESGTYRIIFLEEPVNPFKHGKGIDICYSVNNGEIKKLPAVSEKYDAGTSYEWGQGVLNHVRIAECTAELEKGVNTVSFYGTQVENVLEKIIVAKKDVKLPGCYLGPAESNGKGR